MTLAEILESLFPAGHAVNAGEDGTLVGSAKRRSGAEIALIGLRDGVALGTAAVLPLADHVLKVVEKGGATPILVLVDTRGQRMSRRDELRGLNEYLAHLAKCLLLASGRGHRTIGLDYGKATAGAFLATALATDTLVALPHAQPSVMDLPSIARVTKLSLESLKQLAKTTPVFAPDLGAFTQTGAVAEIWDPSAPLDVQLEQTLGSASPRDQRDELGAKRKGRRLAASVAERVIAAAVKQRHGAASAA